MTIFEYGQKDRMKNVIIKRYIDYRKSYSNPKTQTEIREMFDRILDPLDGFVHGAQLSEPPQVLAHVLNALGEYHELLIHQEGKK